MGVIIQRIIVVVVIFFVVGFFVTTVASWVRQSFAKESIQYKILSPLADPVGSSKKLIRSITNPHHSLKNTVENSMQGSKGDYAIVIINKETGESYQIQEHKTYESASLYKLWVMASVYDLIDKGKIKESGVLTKDIADLNKKFFIASESAELKDGEISMPVSQALTQMITISHNYAALLLSDRIGLKNVGTFLKNNGFNESAIGQPPKTTASDIALFYQKLFSGQLVNPVASTKMLELLKKQQLNDRIPKYLPSDVLVAHKTGEIDYFKHDAGIVYGKNGPYIFVVLSESEFPQSAAERIAILSKAVYDYFAEED